MIKALSIETMFAEVPLYERFARVREAGFDCVEIGDWTELDFSRVTAAMGENRLRLIGMDGATKYSLTDAGQRDDFLEYLSQSLAVAKMFGCTNLVVTSARDALHLPFDGTRREDFSRVSAATRALAEAAILAERAGITLFVNPCPPGTKSAPCLLGTPSVDKIVGAVNSPAVRMLLDLSGMELADDRLADALRPLRGILGYIHIGVAGGPDAEAKLAGLRRVLVDEIHYQGVVVFTQAGDGAIGPALETLRAF